MASKKYRKIVTDMFSYNGDKKLIFVGKSSSPDLYYACCGYDNNNLPAIIINEERLDLLSFSSVISILAHEIGHYYSHDIDDSILTKQMELNADFRNGFWCSRNGFNDLSAIFFSYGSVGADETHPSFEDKTFQVKQGWDLGKTIFPVDSFTNLITQNSNIYESTKKIQGRGTVERGIRFSLERKQ